MSKISKLDETLIIEMLNKQGRIKECICRLQNGGFDSLTTSQMVERAELLPSRVEIDMDYEYATPEHKEFLDLVGSANESSKNIYSNSTVYNFSNAMGQVFKGSVYKLESARFSFKAKSDDEPIYWTTNKGDVVGVFIYIGENGRAVLKMLSQDFYDNINDWLDYYIELSEFDCILLCESVVDCAHVNLIDVKKGTGVQEYHIGLMTSFANGKLKVEHIYDFEKHLLRDLFASAESEDRKSETQKAVDKKLGIRSIVIRSDGAPALV